jgi:hypothetical protein
VPGAGSPALTAADVQSHKPAIPKVLTSFVDMVLASLERFSAKRSGGARRCAAAY